MLSFIFPGQGSQYAGMGKDLAENFDVARRTFEEADEALEFRLSALCFAGPEDDLRLTENTQPAILAASVAALRVLQQERDMAPDFVAGHSLGEFSALVSAGGMDFADALRTVRRRGRFMQQAVPVGEGAMAAIIGLDAAEVESVCLAAAGPEIVSPANFNSPGQVVIAGHAAAVARAMELAKQKGAKRALPLPVSAPFHCALMAPAGKELDEVLSGLNFKALRIPVVTNVEACPNDQSERIRELLVAQVSAPVRWQESVEFMAEQGVKRFIEIGPGKVLSGLVKRIAKNVEIGNLEDSAGLQKI
ncbi:[Acyl-carrier-protein] S-malonyltransferase [Geoalkalibacter ferrihydriticus]|uniref:Malonyl CoA-acyl carrier protein transacylase n=2 Tax=Geoalkalibacter ferrihydriticus TaxID=392333 RepID=A0A0C2HR83_9BACT|nr:ACP S-malonyltransferase [Geoalkalibacter ferrihydriticus]KIH77380.1 ACP S-malonyltransferase [Geoalkalibacter ferrihydriticus DSM 17813]SDM17386.1 [Acyl-carrier-protein] S-malonyltransferase [Geoalkalibacter ferrihydriticus]